MRISDWSSDVCSSDLILSFVQEDVRLHHDTGTKRAGRRGRAGGMSQTPDGRLSDLHSRGQVVPEGATGESIRARLDRKTSERKPGLRLAAVTVAARLSVRPRTQSTSARVTAPPPSRPDGQAYGRRKIG